MGAQPLQSSYPAQPQLFEAFNNRGLVCAHRKEYERAIADFTEAINLDPKNASAYTNRGVGHRRAEIAHGRSLTLKKQVASREGGFPAALSTDPAQHERHRMGSTSANGVAIEVLIGSLGPQ